MATEWTIDGIIRVCGGVGIIADALGLSDSAVNKMKRNGILDRHWSTLIALGDGKFAATDLFAANEVTRRGSIGPSPKDGGA
jgi:hypothetical protein